MIDIITLIAIIVIGIAPVAWEISAFVFRQKEKRDKK